MAGIIVVNDGGTWKSPNFLGNKAWCKDGGTWKEPNFVYVKKSGVWEQVYPSDTETITTEELPTAADRVTSSFYVPNLSSDPAYVYTNMLTAGQEVRWKDRGGPTSLGESIGAADFAWTISDELGFGLGVVSDIEVSFSARRLVASPPPGNYFKIRAYLQQGGASGMLTASLNSTFTVYTMSGSPADWGVSAGSVVADNLYNFASRGTTGKMRLVAVYNNATASSDQEVAIKDIKVQIKYLHN